MSAYLHIEEPFHKDTEVTERSDRKNQYLPETRNETLVQYVHNR